MVQSFQFFRQNSVPCSFNDWTAKATKEAQPRQEQACARSRIAWQTERRYTFSRELTGTTTWRKQLYSGGDAGIESEDEHDAEQPAASGGRHSAPGALLVAEDGKFCIGPKAKVHKFLDAQCYAQR